MEKRFYRDLLLKEEQLGEKFIFVQEENKVQKWNSILVQKEPIVIQEKIKVQEEKESIMVQEEA